MKTCVRWLVSVCILILLSAPVTAQRRGPGTGRGAGGRGQMCAQGQNSSAGVAGTNRFGLNMAAVSAAGVRNIAVANGRIAAGLRRQSSGTNVQTNVAGTMRATANQFVRAAMRFDDDRDGSLNRAELSGVANAVIAELDGQRVRSARRPNAASNQQSSPGSDAQSPAMKRMVARFVQQSMTFDTDKDGNLNAAETTRMATAFLRSLG